MSSAEWTMVNSSSRGTNETNHRFSRRLCVCDLRIHFQSFSSSATRSIGFVQWRNAIEAHERSSEIGTRRPYRSTPVAITPREDARRFDDQDDVRRGSVSCSFPSKQAREQCSFPRAQLFHGESDTPVSCNYSSSRPRLVRIFRR